jgi:hypothetical protein
MFKLKIHAFLVPTLEWDQSASHSVRFTLWERAAGTHLIETWADPSLDVAVKDNIATIPEN